MHRRNHLLLLILLGSALGATAARAVPQQPFDDDSSFENIAAERVQLETEQSSIERQIDSNLLRKREVQRAYDSLNIHEAAYSARLHEASAYCVGQFDQLEYRRRRAWCDTEAGVLDRLRTELAERRGRLDQEDRQRLDDAARLRTRYDGITTRLAALDSSLSGHIVSRLKGIPVPPPIPPDQVTIGFGELAADRESGRVLFGLDAGVAALDIAGQIGGAALPVAKLIIATGKTFIAAENAADVYLVRQHELYERALGWLKDDRTRLSFTAIVIAVKSGQPLPENAQVEMVRAAKAILDPRLGNGGVRIAWDAMMSPEARNAALTQASIELGGEVLGGVARGIVGRLTVEREVAYEEAVDFLSKARVAFEKTTSPEAKISLTEAMKLANEMIAASYRAHAPAIAGMGHLEALYFKYEAERANERPR